MLLKMVVKLKTSRLGLSIDCSDSKVGALLTEASTRKKIRKFENRLGDIFSHFFEACFLVVTNICAERRYWTYKQGGYREFESCPWLPLLVRFDFPEYTARTFNVFSHEYKVRLNSLVKIGVDFGSRRIDRNSQEVNDEMTC